MDVLFVHRSDTYRTLWTAGTYYPHPSNTFDLSN